MGRWSKFYTNFCWPCIKIDNFMLSFQFSIRVAVFWGNNMDLLKVFSWNLWNKMTAFHDFRIKINILSTRLTNLHILHTNFLKGHDVCDKIKTFIFHLIKNQCRKTPQIYVQVNLLNFWMKSPPKIIMK